MKQVVKIDQNWTAQVVTPAPRYESRSSWAKNVELKCRSRSDREATWTPKLMDHAREEEEVQMAEELGLEVRPG